MATADRLESMFSWISSFLESETSFLTWQRQVLSAWFTAETPHAITVDAPASAGVDSVMSTIAGSHATIDEMTDVPLEMISVTIDAKR